MVILLTLEVNMRGMFLDEEHLFKKVVFPSDEKIAIRYRVMLAARWLTIHGIRSYSRVDNKGKYWIRSRNGRFAVKWHQPTKLWTVLVPFAHPNPEEFVFGDFRDVTQFLLEDIKLMVGEVLR